MNYASFITWSTTIQIPLCTFIVCGKGTTHITTQIYFYLVTSNGCNIILGLWYSTSIFYRSGKQGPMEPLPFYVEPSQNFFKYYLSYAWCTLNHFYNFYIRLCYLTSRLQIQSTYPKPHNSPFTSIMKFSIHLVFNSPLVWVFNHYIRHLNLLAHGSFNQTFLPKKLGILLPY